MKRGESGRDQGKSVGIEHLIPVDRHLPIDIRAGIVRIARQIEKYELLADYATNSGQKSDMVDLFAVLEQDGVMTPAVVREIELLGRAVHKEVYRINKDVWNFRIDPRNAHAVGTKVEKEQAAFDAALRKVQRVFISTNRPLAMHFLQEAMTFSYLLSLERKITSFGLAKADAILTDDVAQGLESIDQAQLMAWFHAASMLEAEPPSSSFSWKEYHEVLCTADFMPASVPFQLPGVTLAGVPVEGKFISHAEEWPFFLIGIEIGKTRPLRMMLSRVTGELVPNGMEFTALREQFRFMKKEQEYEAFVARIYEALVAAYEDGKLAEREFIVTRAEARPLVTSETTRPVVSEEERRRLEREAVARQIAEWNAPRRSEGEKRPPMILQRRMTWHRIMSALKRCGVEIDVGHAHPKLKYAGRVTSYLNSHDTDTGHNRLVLKRTLEDLGISEDDFFGKLR